MGLQKMPNSTQKIQGFRTKIAIKYVTESKIKKKDYFKKKWVLIPI